MLENVTHFGLQEQGWILNANQYGLVMPNGHHKGYTKLGGDTDSKLYHIQYKQQMMTNTAM